MNYLCIAMIASDLTNMVQHELKTAQGQINYILERINDPEQAHNVLIQLKSVQGLINKATIELLDDAYRKALAERISQAVDQCPGNCGNEQSIEHLLKIFPDIKPEEIPVKLMQIEKMNRELQIFISKNNLNPSLSSE